MSETGAIDCSGAHKDAFLKRWFVIEMARGSRGDDTKQMGC